MADDLGGPLIPLFLDSVASFLIPRKDESPRMLPSYFIMIKHHCLDCCIVQGTDTNN